MTVSPFRSKLVIFTLNQNLSVAFGLVRGIYRRSNCRFLG